MFKHMDHVAMSVSDMEKTIAFYRDVIGMEKVFDRRIDQPMVKLLNTEGASARVVHMKRGDAMVELFNYSYPTAREPLPGRQQSDLGLSHIGFLVNDFQSVYQHLQKHKVKFLGEPVEIRPGVFVAYFKGAEHEVIEIREIVSRKN